MNNLNKLIIEGNAVREANLSSNSVLNFSLACNRSYKNNQGEFTNEVSYFDCVAFGKIAEYAEKKIVKGRGIRVIGRLRQNRWTDKDGNNRSRIEVICESLEFKPLKTQSEQISETISDDIPVSYDESESEMVF